MRGGTIREEVHWKNDAISGSTKLKNALFRAYGYAIPKKVPRPKPIAPVFVAPHRGRGRPKGAPNKAKLQSAEVRRIQLRVGGYYRVSLRRMRGDRRLRKITLARQTAMYAVRHALGTSYPTIGKLFGGRNHSTVIHACREVQKRIDAGCGRTIRALGDVHSHLNGAA